jgi:hypothetical protein
VVVNGAEVVVAAEPPLLLPELDAAMRALKGLRPGKKVVGIAGIGIWVPSPQALISLGMVWIA